MTVEEARSLGKALAQNRGPGPEVVRATDDVIPADNREIPVRLIVPHAAPRAVIVYFHGGGWVLGGLDEFDTLGRQIAVKTGATVVLVGYRLAPEHPYPAAVEDACTKSPVIVMGDSAGGNLAAVSAQYARDNSLGVAMQVLVYPVTDHDLDNTAYHDAQNQLLLSRETMKWFSNLYAPNSEDRLNATASPLAAEDLAGLPRAVVVTAELDVLQPEGEAYAEKLARAGVEVEHRRFTSQMHGFFTMVNSLPGAEAGLEYVCDHVTAFLAMPRSTQAEETT
jgi:acetyl esterase